MEFANRVKRTFQKSQRSLLIGKLKFSRTFISRRYIESGKEKKDKMLKILKQKRAALYVIALLMIASTIVAVSANVLVKETKTFSATNYNLQYDNTKLSVTDISGITYDSIGNLDKFNLTVQNKDPANAYNGSLETSISGQAYDIDLPLIAPNVATQITIDLKPNLPVTSTLSITATVYVSDPTPTTTPPSTQTPTSTTNPTTTPTSTNASAPTQLPSPSQTSTPNPIATPASTQTTAPTATQMPIPAGVDFAAIKATSIPDAQIDGTIGPEWNDAKHYQNIPIDPQGTAEIWIKNDGTNLYFAIQFTADSSNPWLSLELGSSGIHNSGADFAVFGDDNLSPNNYSDAYFASFSSVKADVIQNGKGAMTVNTGNVITIELMKPLSSGDTAGKDIAWTIGNTYNMVIAWDSNGGGSSGGTVDHTKGTTPTARTIFISG